jgi:hypothetical protein
MKTKTALFVLLVLVLAACAPAVAPTVEQSITPAQSTEPPATEPASPEPSPAIPITGPSLNVGDVYFYFDGTTLAAVPPGEFSMGGNGTDNPEHAVNLRGYWIYSTLVTNQQFTVCVQLGNCTAPDSKDNPGYSDVQRANHPVTGVTYDQAAAYCSFVGGRLPTEAEWEKAAGNSKGGDFPWGDQAPTCDLANFEDCVGGKTNVTEHTGGASYYGALDMFGNVFQWVADWYDAGYYNNSPADDPTGPESGTARVLRSSGFNTSPDQLSTKTRSSEDPQTHRSDIGFRCVVDQPQQFAPLCEIPPVYAADAASSTCPTLELQQEELCAQNFPYTNVTVMGAADAKIESKTCDPLDDPAKVTCQPPSTVSASAGCELTVSGQPACPDGYSPQDGVCVANGAQGACPAGLNFDSSNQCCGFPAGTDASIQTICPAGMHFIADQNACFPNAVNELVTVNVKVAFKDCSAKSPGGGGGTDVLEGTPAPACDQPPDKCMYQRWDPQLCKCVPL